MKVESFVQGARMITRVTWEIESVPGSEDYDTPTDPTTVVFTARRRNPEGRLEAAVEYELADPEVTKISDGVFEFTHEPEPGKWYVHAQGTGAAHGSAKVEYEIEDSEALAA